jgi:uncharacterized membrane protein (UPF0127 family)
MTTRACWLVSNGHVLASAEEATDRRERSKGLLRRDGVDGAFVIPQCRWVHTFGMRFAIDVAHVDEHGTVLRTVRMRPNRLGAPVWHARTVVEAEAGAFARWGLGVGDVVEIRE